MGVVADMDVIEAAAVDGLTDAPVAWPNRQFTPPTKTNDPDNPASWYLVETEYGGDGGESTEELTFERDEMRRGEVIIGCWVEPQTGEGRVHAMVDAARAAFASASTPLVNFLRPHVERGGLGTDVGGESWYGWFVRVPFIAQD